MTMSGVFRPVELNLYLANLDRQVDREEKIVLREPHWIALSGDDAEPAAGTVAPMASTNVALATTAAATEPTTTTDPEMPIMEGWVGSCN